MAALTLRAIPAVRRASALYCTTHGRGTPLLLIHGLGQTGAVFQPLISKLPSYYQSIVPDLRGHGHSSRLPASDNIARLATDVENLLDLLDISSCFVLGHAAGGAVAQQLTHDYPTRVCGLVLSSTYARNATSLREQVEGRIRLGANHVTEMLRANKRNSYSVQKDETNTDRYTQLTLSFDSRSWLPALTCPALVVAGAADSANQLYRANELAGLLSHAQLQIIPGAGYGLIKTHVDALLNLMLPWLTEQGVAA